MTRRHHEPTPLATSYGWAYAMIRDNPEVRAIMAEALASGEWDEASGMWAVAPMSQAEFTERVMATAWYQAGVAAGRIRL